MAESVAKAILNDTGRVFELQKNYSLELRKERISNRKGRLILLREWIHKNRSHIHHAMYADFQKASQEVDAIELFHVLNEIKHALTNLDQWTRRRKIDAPLTMLGTRSFIQYEPKGVCLIISPWNYPFCLAIGPLVSALAAGNTAIIKPSEQTPNVSRVIKEMVAEIFEEKIVAVFEGGAEVSVELLELPFDHIFFTGSTEVGKSVMKAAAENLTSVTLELGGKSPCVVAADADLNDAAERIAVGKFVNNGQTCIAPDYILVDEKVEKKFTELLIIKQEKLFASDGKGFEKSSSYCRIINEKHFQRLTGLVEDAIERGAAVQKGGTNNAGTRFFHPIVLSNIPLNAKLMQEEIFGPIVPVIPYKRLEEAIAFINGKPKPLALYVFTSNKKSQDKILNETSAGGVCVNDCGIHFLNHALPFGGVNQSGMGKSHGLYGFLAFSNEKPVLKQKNGITSVRAFYPPYTETSRRLMDWFLKFF